MVPAAKRFLAEVCIGKKERENAARYWHNTIKRAGKFMFFSVQTALKNMNWL